jgi:hypothetical protein
MVSPRELQQEYTRFKEEAIKAAQITVREDIFSKLSLYDYPHQFCIISKATNLDPTNNIVYKQLHRIKEEHKKIGSIGIKCFNTVNMKEKALIYVIHFSKEILNHYLDELEFSIFNMKHQFHISFQKEFYKEFEPGKDYYAHEIYRYILMKEFDINLYKTEGMIVDYFSLHQFRQKKQIMRFWKTERNLIFNNSFSLDPALSNIRSFTSIAIYYGVKVGLFFGFYGHYNSWLLLPSITGLCTFALGYFVTATSTGF